jgi:hypothetical protein
VCVCLRMFLGSRKRFEHISTLMHKKVHWPSGLEQLPSKV